MPISYQPMQPLNTALMSDYGRTSQAAQQGAARAAASSREAFERDQLAVQMAGINARQFSDDADRLQGAMDNVARQRLANMQFAASGSPTARDEFLATAESNQMRDRYVLQSQLQEVELNQQEKMRLARMKNAVSEVSADPSLSDEEKSAMIMQLKTGINPLEQRSIRMRVEAEAQFKQQQVEAMQFKQAQETNFRKLVSGEADKFVAIIPNTEVAQQLRETFKDLHPDKDPNGPEAKAWIQNRAIAMGPGNYVRLMPNSKGELEPLDEGVFGGVGKGAPGRGPGGSVGAGGAATVAGRNNQINLNDIYKDVEASVDAQIGKEGSVITQANRQDHIDNRVEQRLKSIQKHMGGGEQQRPARPAPFKPEVPGSGTPLQEVQVSKVDDTVRYALMNPQVPQREKEELGRAATQLKNLMAKYLDKDGTFNGADDEIQQKMRELLRKINKHEPPPVSTAPAARPQAQAPADDRSIPRKVYDFIVDPNAGTETFDLRDPLKRLR